MNIYKNIIVALLVFIACLSCSSCEFNSMFYNPSKVKTDINWENSEVGFFKGTDGKNLNYVFAKPAGKAIATVFVLHGQDGNIATSKGIVSPFVKNGFQVFMFDYQGFGKSEGIPNHNNVLADAEIFLNYIKSREETKNIKLLVAGFSLGGQLSIALTAKNQDKIDDLLVEGTFTSHGSMAAHTTVGFFQPFVRYFVTSDYNAKELIATINIPKLIVHSIEDPVIPYFMGVELFNAAVHPKIFWEIKGDHIYGFKLYEDEYFKKINSLLSL